MDRIYKINKIKKSEGGTKGILGSRVQGFKSAKGVKRQVRRQKTGDRSQKGEERSMKREKGEEGEKSVKGVKGSRVQEFEDQAAGDNPRGLPAHRNSTH